MDTSILFRLLKWILLFILVHKFMIRKSAVLSLFVTLAILYCTYRTENRRVKKGISFLSASGGVGICIGFSMLGVAVLVVSIIQLTVI